MDNLIIVRGGGDIATGTIYKLYQCGFPVLILEIPNPSAIRRNVAFSEAVYQGEQTVEDVTCVLADDLETAKTMLEEGRLVMLIDPVKAIYFVIFILIVQQFDGNILGPKILGDSIGLSSFWVMFAILVFGGAFGFTGMVIGVPLMAIIFSTVSALMRRRLKRKGMPYQTTDYMDMECIDPESRTPVKHSTVKRAAPESVVLKKEKGLDD